MLELMFTLALGIILGLSSRMTSSVSHALGVITKICLFIMIFCLAAKIGCDEAVIKVLPLIGQCLLPLFWRHSRFFLSHGPRRMASSGSFYSPSVRR